MFGVGLNEAVARYVPHYETSHSLRPFLRRAIALAGGVGVVLCLLGWMASRPLASVLFETFRQRGDNVGVDFEMLALVRLTVAGVLTLIVYMLVLAVLRGLRMFLAYSIAEVAGNVAFTVFAVVVVLAGQRSSQAVMVTYCVGYGSVAVLFGLLLMQALRRMKDQNEPLPLQSVETLMEQPCDAGRYRSVCLTGQMLRFSVWTALGALLWQAMQYYPMWYLQKAQGSEVTAIFCGRTSHYPGRFNRGHKRRDRRANVGDKNVGSRRTPTSGSAVKGGSQNDGFHDASGLCGSECCSAVGDSRLSGWLRSRTGHYPVIADVFHGRRPPDFPCHPFHANRKNALSVRSLAGRHRGQRVVRCAAGSSGAVGGRCAGSGCVGGRVGRELGSGGVCVHASYRATNARSRFVAADSDDVWLVVADLRASGGHGRSGCVDDCQLNYFRC